MDSSPVRPSTVRRESYASPDVRPVTQGSVRAGGGQGGQRGRGVRGRGGQLTRPAVHRQAGVVRVTRRQTCHTGVGEGGRGSGGGQAGGRRVG